MNKIYAIIILLIGISYGEDQSEKFIIESVTSELWSTENYDALNYLFKKNLELDSPDISLVHASKFFFHAVSNNYVDYEDALISQKKIFEKLGNEKLLGLSDIDINNFEETSINVFSSSSSSYLLSHARKSSPDTYPLISLSLQLRLYLDDPSYVSEQVIQIVKELETDKVSDFYKVTIRDRPKIKNVDSLKRLEKQKLIISVEGNSTPNDNYKKFTNKIAIFLLISIFFILIIFYVKQKIST